LHPVRYQLALLAGGLADERQAMGYPTEGVRGNELETFSAGNQSAVGCYARAGRLWRRQQRHQRNVAAGIRRLELPGQLRKLRHDDDDDIDRGQLRLRLGLRQRAADVDSTGVAATELAASDAGYDWQCDGILERAHDEHEWQCAD
jgi:hypothetical protein